MSAAIGAVTLAIGKALTSRIWTGSNERAIQDAMAVVLAEPLDLRGPVVPWRLVREHRLSDRDRVDFAVVLECRLPNVVAIEVKVTGTVMDVMQQMQRYSRHPDVGALILASASRRLVAAMPREFSCQNGDDPHDRRRVPVYACVLRRM